jgi:hypothetical protein
MYNSFIAKCTYIGTMATNNGLYNVSRFHGALCTNNDRLLGFLHCLVGKGVQPPSSVGSGGCYTM